MSNNNFRFAIVSSHPIQYFCPEYVSFSKLPGVEIKLFFASAQGYKKYVDKNYGMEIAWNNLRLDEFNHVFLNGEEVLPITKELDAPNLPGELEKFKPDAVLTYGYFIKAQKRACNWALKNNIPVVYMTDAENRQHRKLYVRLAKFFYLSWYFRKPSFFFTIGDANEEYYKTYGVPSKKFIRMHHPIDIETYDVAFANKAALRKKIREQYGIPENEFVISVVGKLVEWKNQGHLIDLLAHLEAKGVKAHLLIMGTGKTEKQLKEKAAGLKSNKAHFVGFVDPLMLPEYYAASDVYIHPAMIEPHSLAISEAIYMGCPVIISDRCGSYGEDDDVQVNKNGFVYRFGDIGELSEKVQKLASNPSLCEQFGKYSHEVALKYQARSHRECVLELKKRLNK